MNAALWIGGVGFVAFAIGLVVLSALVISSQAGKRTYRDDDPFR